MTNNLFLKIGSKVILISQYKKYKIYKNKKEKNKDTSSEDLRLYFQL